MSAHQIFPLTPQQRGEHRLQVAKDLNLSALALRVMVVLDHHYNSKTGLVFPKQKTIADTLGCSREAVNRAIRQLVNQGHLHSYGRDDVAPEHRGRKRRGNYYVFVLTGSVSSGEHRPGTATLPYDEQTTKASMGDQPVTSGFPTMDDHLVTVVSATDWQA